MVQLVIFINLFFVPLLPLYIIYRKKQTPLAPNLELMFQYGIIAVCNIPLTKVCIFLMNKAAGVFISIDSGYYTVAALLPTVSIILAYQFYKVYPDHKPWKEKIVQKGFKGVIKDLAPACILLFVSCFMLLVFEPILMYATNMTDFWFDFRIMIWPVFRIFARFLLVGILIIFAIYNADLLISKRLLLYKGITLIGSVVFFLTYLQGNWLAGSLPLLDGAEIVWENYGKQENLILTLAMVILAAAMIISIRKRGLNRTVFYTAVCTSVVFVMLFTSLIPTMVTNKVLENNALGGNGEDVFSPTFKNINTISANKNFLIFLVDAVDSKPFYDVMMGDEDFRGIMEDFTYYPDTLSVYPFTKASLPSILTGEVNYNKIPFQDYCNSAYNQSPLFDKLVQNDYEINLYSNQIYWVGEKNYNIENTESIYDILIDLNLFMKEEWKYILFKYMPYGLKQVSNIETLDFNTCKIMNGENEGYEWYDQIIYDRITKSSVLDKQDQNYFHFFHCEGGHIPFNLDKNLDTIENGTYAQKLAASLTMIKAYLQRLKNNDAYDNSVIVIMADHGFESPYGGPQYILSRCNPILFIKGINEKHEMYESDRSVSYMDLQDAFSDLLDGKQSTELFADLKPGRTRTVLWHPPESIAQLIEYSTSATAREMDKYIPTGIEYILETK